MEKVTKGLTNWLSSEGMTQKDVAEKLGVSEQFVNALFNGRREFGKKTANDWLRRHWVQPLVVSYVCVPDLPFSGTFIFVSRTCKSALLNQSVMHNRGVSAPFATSRCGSPLLSRSLHYCV